MDESNQTPNPSQDSVGEPLSDEVLQKIAYLIIKRIKDEEKANEQR